MTYSVAFSCSQCLVLQASPLRIRPCRRRSILLSLPPFPFRIYRSTAEPWSASTRRSWAFSSAYRSATAPPHRAALHGFAYDDQGFRRGQRQCPVRLGRQLAHFLSPLPARRQPREPLYRPLTALSYAVDQRIAPRSAQGRHASNLLYSSSPSCWSSVRRTGVSLRSDFRERDPADLILSCACIPLVPRRWILLPSHSELLPLLCLPFTLHLLSPLSTHTPTGLPAPSGSPWPRLGMPVPPSQRSGLVFLRIASRAHLLFSRRSTDDGRRRRHRRALPTCR